jgi:REP-associated tyrosine transposase
VPAQHKRNQGLHRLRIGRRSIANQIYHVTTVTAGRRRLFTELRSGRFVVQTLMRIQASQLADTLAFVVMPDHMHWLLQLGSNQNLSRVVGSMKSGSSRQMRRRRQPGASIWQSGFHDRALRCDEDLAQVARYIIANPLRAGLVERIGDYPLWDAVWLDMT